MSGARERNRYVEWYQQHKTVVWGAAATAVALYATYKATSGSGKDSGPGPGRPQRPQGQFQRLCSMLSDSFSAASTIAETAALVSNDLRTFLTSDSSELPQSLRQLNRLLQTPELQDTVSTLTASVVRGAANAAGLASLASSSPGAGPSALLDTIIEAVLSERGRGLIGMAVGVATRNATVAMCEFLERRMDAAAGAPGGRGFSVKDFLDILVSEQGERALTMLLTNSIRTAVTSYVDATTGYNMYDDLLSSIAKTEHREAIADLMSRVTATFCKEVAVAYRRSASAAASSAATSTAGGGSGGGANHAAAFGGGRQSSGGRDRDRGSETGGGAAGGGGAVASGSTVALTASAGSAAPAADGGAASTTTPATAATADSAPPSPLTPSRPGNAALALCSQNGRSQQLSHQLSHQVSHHKLHGGVNSGGSAALSRAMLAQAPPPWLRQVVDLVRERDVRSLALDVVTAASREATRGAVEGLMQGGGGACGGAYGGLMVLPPCLRDALGAKLLVLASLALALGMYALSPRTMLL